MYSTVSVPDAMNECANCCVPVTPNHESEGALFGSTVINSNGQIISVKMALCKVFTFDYLPDDEALPEMVRLCPNCTSVLTDLYNIYDMFRNLRKVESYVSAKIGRLDEIVRRNANSSSIWNHEDGDGSSVIIGDIKEEPIEDYYDDLNSTMPSPEVEEPERNIVFPTEGPWVKLVRLRPEDIPNDPTSPPESNRRNCSEEASTEDTEGEKFMQ